MIVKIVGKLLELIVVKIPQIGIKIVKSIIDGLFSYWNKMLSKIKEFFKGTILEGFVNKVADMGKAGLQLIQGLWNGIKDATSWLWNKVSGFCNDLLGKIKGFFGIHSPSKVFEDEIGENLGLGIGVGFEDSLYSVYRRMRKVVEHENAKLTTNLTTNSNYSRDLIANISISQGDVIMDGTKVGRMVTPIVSKTLKGAGAY